MNPLYFTLAVEDELSEAVARQIIDQCGRPFIVAQCLRRGGFGYLRNKIRSLNKAAAGLPFFVLTDLDDPGSCAPNLIQSWLGSHRRRRNLVFRVAVMEIESWIMAHRESVASFLKVPLNRVPLDTDAILKPKEFLVGLAGHSPAT